MAREAHLEAAKHHMDAASKHLEAVGRYNEGDVDGAVHRSHEARVASELADGKSIEAHRQAIVALVSFDDWGERGAEGVLGLGAKVVEA